ncbi:MAG: hypothetical protein ACLSCO_01985 [Gallintestinimicrobium sp.]
MEINGDSVEELMERIRTADELVYPMERVEENNLPPIAGMIVRFDPKKDYSDLNSHLAVYQEGRKLFQDYFQTCFGEENFGAVSQLYVEDTYPLAAYLSKIYDLDQKKVDFFCPESKNTGLVPEDDPAGRRKLLVYQNRGTGSDLCVPPVKNQPVCGRKPDGISARSPCPAAGRLVDQQSDSDGPYDTKYTGFSDGCLRKYRVCKPRRAGSFLGSGAGTIG